MLNFLKIRRPLALMALLGLLSASVLGGCASSSTKSIDKWQVDSSYEIFQDELAGKDVTIFLGDETTRQGKSVLINEERTSWQGPDLTERSKIATSEVWKLEASGGSNAGSGAMTGFLVFGGLGVLVGATSSDSDFFGGPAGSALVVGGVLGLLGALLGAIFGSASSATMTYEINSDLAWEQPEPEPEMIPIDPWDEGY